MLLYSSSAGQGRGACLSCSVFMQLAPGQYPQLFFPPNQKGQPEHPTLPRPDMPSHEASRQIQFTTSSPQKGGKLCYNNCKADISQLPPDQDFIKASKSQSQLRKSTCKNYSASVSSLLYHLNTEPAFTVRKLISSKADLVLLRTADTLLLLRDGDISLRM